MNTNRSILIDISDQKLFLLNGDEIEKHYIVSTAKNGAGELLDSECTPRGNHIIAEKIGDGEKINTVFVGRKPTGEIYNTKSRQQHPGRDWILTRILWLQGTDMGCNQGGKVDSHERYIYIHGSPDDIEMGTPGSRGCIRMNNHQIIELFDQIEEGTRVVIKE